MLHCTAVGSFRLVHGPHAKQVYHRPHVKQVYHRLHAKQDYHRLHVKQVCHTVLPSVKGSCFFACFSLPSCTLIHLIFSDLIQMFLFLFKVIIFYVVGCLTSCLWIKKENINAGWTGGGEKGRGAGTARRKRE